MPSNTSTSSFKFLKISTIEKIREIETRVCELVEELDNGGDLLGGLTRMNMSLSDLMTEEDLSLYSCFIKQRL